MTPLGPILEPSWTPCWPHVGPMLEAVGRLGASWSVLGAYLEAISDQHRTEDERKRLDSRKIIKNNEFCLFFEVPEVPT